MVYVVAAIAAILLFSSSSGIFEKEETGNPTIDFTLSDTDGNAVTLSEMRGRVVVLNFMATWCPGCRAEISALAEVDAQYPDEDVVILSISTEDSATLQSFKEGNGAVWAFLIDDGSVFSQYGVSVIPSNFVISPGGQVVYHDVGAMSGEELREQIERAR